MFIGMLQNEVMKYPEEEKSVEHIYECKLRVIYFFKNQHVGARTKH